MILETAFTTAYRFPMVPNSPLIIMFSPADPGSANFSPRPLAASFAPPSKMYFFLECLRGTIVFRIQACQSGPIIVIVSFTVFRLQTAVDSKWPTTLAAQSSTQLQENAL